MWEGVINDHGLALDPQTLCAPHTDACGIAAVKLGPRLLSTQDVGQKSVSVNHLDGSKHVHRVCMSVIKCVRVYVCVCTHVICVKWYACGKSL